MFFIKKFVLVCSSLNNSFVSSTQNKDFGMPISNNKRKAGAKALKQVKRNPMKNFDATFNGAKKVLAIMSRTTRVASHDQAVMVAMNKHHVFY